MRRIPFVVPLAAIAASCSTMLAGATALAAVSLSNGLPTGVLPTGTSSISMSFTTDPAASQCKYSTTPGTSFGVMSEAFSMRGTSRFHTMIHSLANGGSYRFFIRCIDASGSVNTTDYEIAFSVADVPPPEVTGVSGQLIHGGTIVITGSRFGTKTPAAPMVWDDFERGVDGEYLADHSAWVAHGSTGAPYSSERAYSGELAAHNRVTASSGTSFRTNHATFPPTNRVYASYVFRIESPSVDRYGVLKMSRLASNYDGPVDHVDYYNGPGNTSWGRSDRDCANGGLAASYDSGNAFVQRYISSVAEDRWQRMEMYKVLSSPGAPDGQVFFARDRQMGWRELGIVTRDAGFSFQLQYFTLGLMLANARSDGDFSLFIDDVYVDSTLARVEICDKPTWGATESEGAHCEPQIPSSWSSDSITVTVNQGTFPNEAAYLFVIDELGNVSTGKPIVFGAADRRPSAPQHLRVR